MTEPLVRPGEGEAFKGLVHVAIFGLAAMCWGYNSLAASQRRETHLAVNVVAYSALLWFEWRQIRRHLQAMIDHG